MNDGYRWCRCYRCVENATGETLSRNVRPMWLKVAMEMAKWGMYVLLTIRLGPSVDRKDMRMCVCLLVNKESID